ncbi:MAG: twin-arginine translocase subunit TatC, partial [Flavobacteriales bacterium]|nr:twin-arginine translocase subunit TatC [Flavobacteriales bacterium]
SIIGIAVGAIAVFSAKSFVFDKIIFAPQKTDFLTYRGLCWLSGKLGFEDTFCVTEINYKLINTAMVGQFTAHLLVSIIGGFIIAFPFVYYQAWSFVKPGLRQREVKAVRGVVFYASFLFFIGIFFGYYMVSPLSLQFLGNYQVGESIESTITIMSYMKTIASISLAAGLVFQLPILVYFLTKIGLVTPEMLRKFRKHALVAVLVLSAVITPPDVTSQILVSIPVLILYEISILISKRVVAGRTEIVQA